MADQLELAQRKDDLPSPYSAALLQRCCPQLKPLYSGKVRDLYALDEERMLIVSSDRISAFDVVLPTDIPGKGEVLTACSQFWFAYFQDVRNHCLATPITELLPDFPACPRTMLVRRLQALPVEIIVRGYLTGSGWQEYCATGHVSGHRLPVGMLAAERLKQPLLTPSTKAPLGSHDEPLDFDSMAALIGGERAEKIRSIALDMYQRAADYAAARGILIADTKFEFGVDKAGDLFLIDEVLTPDSSRFWPREQWRPGTTPDSYDKQYLRDYLQQSGWNKEPPGPDLPLSVVTHTGQLYRRALAVLQQ